jgi:hypothetical protein
MADSQELLQQQQSVDGPMMDARSSGSTGHSGFAEHSSNSNSCSDDVVDEDYDGDGGGVGGGKAKENEGEQMPYQQHTHEYYSSEDDGGGGGGGMMRAGEPKGPPQACLFVASLSPDTSEDALHELFARHGEVLKIKLMKDRSSRPYAFVQYSVRACALAVCRVVWLPMAVCRVVSCYE